MKRDLYQHYDRLLVAVDCIIFGFSEGELKILLIKRDFEPEKDRWSLMGGFVNKEESADHAANRILKKLTGLNDVYLEQLQSFNKVDRDPVERTISLAYFALINVEEHNEELIKKNSARWFSVKEFPEVIFDHGEMIQMARRQLRNKAMFYPLGFELLPEKFTMPELQALYESIFDAPIDKRNFIRRITSLDILIKLNEKKKGNAIRHAYLYKFDYNKYKSLMDTGFNYLVRPTF